MNQAEWKQVAIEALTKSIEHWNRHATDTALPDEGINGDDCECCKAFIKKAPLLPPCTECPVALRTGRSGCAETPWLSCTTSLGCEGDSTRTNYRFRTNARRMENWLVETLELVKSDKLTLQWPYLHRDT